MALKQRQISFIGGGHITEMLIQNFMETKTLARKQIIVSDAIKAGKERADQFS